jgi:type II secretory pathway component PulF
VKRFVITTGILAVTLPLVVAVYAAAGTRARWQWFEDYWPWLAVGFVLLVIAAWRSIQQSERIRQLEQRCLRLEGAVYLLAETHRSSKMHAAVLSERSRSTLLDGEEEAHRIAQALSDSWP